MFRQLRVLADDEFLNLAEGIVGDAHEVGTSGNTIEVDDSLTSSDVGIVDHAATHVDDAAVSLAGEASHIEADLRGGGVGGQQEVHVVLDVADIQPFLADAGGDGHILGDVTQGDQIVVTHQSGFPLVFRLLQRSVTRPVYIVVTLADHVRVIEVDLITVDEYGNGIGSPYSNPQSIRAVLASSPIAIASSTVSP